MRINKQQNKAFINVLRLRWQAITTPDPDKVKVAKLIAAEKEWNLASQGTGKYATSPNNPLIQ